MGNPNDYSEHIVRGWHVTDSMSRANDLAAKVYTQALQWGTVYPGSIALSPDGLYLYVLEQYFTPFLSGGIVKKFNVSTGALVTSWGSGTFTGPDSIAVDADGYVYVTDNTPGTGPFYFRIYKYTSGGSLVWRHEYYATVPPYSATDIFLPRAIAVDNSFHTITVETRPTDIQYVIRRRAQDNTLVAEWVIGTPSARLAAADVVYATAGNTIRVYSLTGTLLDTFGSTGTGAGEFTSLGRICLDGAGYLYAADYPGGNHRIQKFTTDGEFVTSFRAPSSVGNAGVAAYENFAYGADGGASGYITKYEQLAPVEFYAYGHTTKESIGTAPDKNALLNAFGGAGAGPVGKHILDVREAIEAIIACGHFKNPATGNAYNWTDDDPDNLYYVAMGDRTKYGATGGARYDWTHASLDGLPLYDLHPGEIYECIVTLESADTP